MADYQDIIINVNSQAASQPILARKRATIPGTLPIVTAGDGDPAEGPPLKARLWFYDGVPQSLTSTNVRFDPSQIGLFAKVSRTVASPYLFEIVKGAFTEITDTDGDYGYEGALDLNTVELINATAPGSNISTWCDVVVGTHTHQFQMPARPQVDSGGIPPSPAEPPYPPSAEILDKLPTADEKAAMDAADSPSVTNPFATQSDIANLPTFDEKQALDEAYLPGFSNPYITQLALDKDPRLGTPGGVNLQNGGFASDSIFIFGSHDFSFHSTVRRRNAAANGAITDAASGLLLQANTDGSIAVFDRVASSANIFTTPAGTLPIDGVVAVTVVRASGVITLYANGTSVGSAACTSNFTSAQKIGVFYDAANTFLGDIVQIAGVNRALSSGEILSVAKGEIPAALAFQALNAPSDAWINGGVGTNYPTFASTGLDNISVSSPAAGHGAYFAFHDSKRGSLLRITGNISSFTGVPILAGNGPSGGSSLAIWSNVSGAVSIGSNPWDLRIVGTGAFSADVYCFEDSMRLALYDTDGAISVNLTGITVRTLGTVEAYDPHTVTTLGRWRGRFGNDLLPGTGITPLAPEPVQTRMISFVYDMVAAATLKDSGANSGWGAISRPSTGIVVRNLPSYISESRCLTVTPTHGQTQGFLMSLCSMGQIGVISTDISNSPMNDSSLQVNVTWLE